MEKGTTLIRSVSRALHLLDVVGSASRPVPAKTLARRAGVPLPTTYHLLRTLVHEGYLRRTADGYVLGDRIDALSAGTPGRWAARSHEVLQHLHDEVGAAAYLSVLEDGEVRLCDVVDSPEAPRVDLWVGFHDAAHATALGKAVLSTLPAQERREYVATHELVDLTRRTVTDMEVFLRQLEQQSDVALDREEYALGTACVAVPVPSQTLRAAVAVSVPVGQVRRVVERRDELRRAARLIAFASAPGSADGPADGSITI